MSNLKLTEQEENKRILFVGNAVDKNYVLPTNTSFGVAKGMTVQELSNSTIFTLQEIGAAINKSIDGWDSEFSTTPEPMLGKLPASEWVSFIRLTIKKKKFEAAEAARLKEIESLKSEIGSLATVKEKRKAAEAKLAELTKEEV